MCYNVFTFIENIGEDQVILIKFKTINASIYRKSGVRRILKKILY